MTDMTGNPHAGNTNDNILHALADNPPGSAKCTDTLATAHVQATLALAYEQRTANLIALSVAQYANGSAMFPGQIEEARYQVFERLGFGND